MSRLNKGLFTSNTDLWATPQGFFGTLRIPNRWGEIFHPTTEEFKSIIEARLPLLKNKNYKIKL